mmetsp:Transcript_37130/g.63757  ORF Transcript_37130/g.63757 Transcript_37130/m.63757 type:complete len:175 (-) Transcript_37130:180-704(-)
MTNRRSKIFQLAKGYRGRAKNCYRIAIRRVEKGLRYAFRDRKAKKREARQTWIMQVGAGAREHGLGYGRLIHGLQLAEIGVNRKMLSELAQQEPYSFRAIVEEAKRGLREAVLRDPAAAAGAGAPLPASTAPGDSAPVAPTDSTAALAREVGGLIGMAVEAQAAEAGRSAARGR